MRFRALLLLISFGALSLAPLEAARARTRSPQRPAAARVKKAPKRKTTKRKTPPRRPAAKAHKMLRRR